jgi:hypothetical protein
LPLVAFASLWKTRPLPAAGDRGRGGRRALRPPKRVRGLTRGPATRGRRTPLMGFVSKMPLHRHPLCASGPSLRSSSTGEVSCGQDMRSGGLAPIVPPRLRCEPSAPVSQTGTSSARAVSHDFGGLLRARGAGLLHPAADHGVHLVAVRPLRVRARVSRDLPRCGHPSKRSPRPQQICVDLRCGVAAVLLRCRRCTAASLLRLPVPVLPSRHF